MESEINEPELLNKCVRCHQSNDQLIKFTYRRVLGIQGAKFYSINYSICEKCKPYLEKGLKIEDKYVTKKLKPILAGIFLIIYIVALIIFFNSDIPFQAMFPVIGIIIGATLGSFFLILYLNRVLYKTNPENIKKYFEIRNDGIVILKDLKSGNEINRINLLPIERKIAEILPKKSHEFCPNCGSQIKTYTGFCQSCGKNLKV